MKNRLTGEKRSLMLAAASLLFGAILLHALLERLPSLRSAAGAVVEAASPVLWGLGLAFVLNIPMRALEERVFSRLFPEKPGAARAFALVCALLIIPGAAALMIGLLVPRVLESAFALIKNSEAYIGEAERLIRGAAQGLPEGLDAGELTQSLTEYLRQGVKDIISGFAQNLPGLTAGAAGILYRAVVIPVICVHSLVNRDAILRFLKRAATAVLPKKHIEGFLSGCKTANSTFRRYVTAQLTGALIVGSLCYIGSRVLSQPYPELISLLAALGALIPIVGPWAGIGLSAFIILASGSGSAPAFVIMMLVIQLAEDNLIYPRLIGNAIGMRGVEVLAVVIVSGGLFGFTGLLVGVPSAAVIRRLIKSAVDKRNLLRAEAGETA